MKRVLVVLALLGILVTGCSQETPLAPSNTTPRGSLDEEAIARSLIAEAGWQIAPDAAETLPTPPMAEPQATPPILELTRQVIVNDVVHYTFHVRVGPGPYDVIGLHRVVRERRPFQPIRTGTCVFFDHGDFTSFITGFMAATLSPDLRDDHCLPVYLAAHDVDVWGIDHGWALVPAETSDFSFMADWGIMKDVGHMRLAMGICRSVRLLSGNGRNKVTLLGWSTGSVRTFAYAGEETQLPPVSRHVKAIIPIDQYVKTDDPDLIEANCESITPYADDIQQGIYEDDTGAFVQAMAELARTDPGADSPFVPGLTNWQLSILFGSATYLLAFPVAPCFHIAAGTFDGDGLPTGLQHMTEETWLDFLGAFSPWMPNQILVDEFAVVCPDYDVPFDDHLGDIRVPVLWVGAGGGYGDTMEDMMSLLGSTDITGLVVSVDSDRCLDYGHADLFLGDQSEALVWNPILTWVEAH